MLKNLNIKYFVCMLLVVSLVLFFLIASFKNIGEGKLWELAKIIPSVVTIDMILIGFFIKWGWRWKRLQGWLVPFPNLNGTWQGYIQTNWKDAQGNTPGRIPVILTVDQTFGRISCVMQTAEMKSHSYVEGFSIDAERQIRQLCYSYTSKPKGSLRDRSTPHDGTILFNILGKPVHKLEGEYWTQRQTIGTVTLTFLTKELLDELPSDSPMSPVSIRSIYSYGKKK